tara:strand:+ start:204 stop:1076 length:873 start_codon:yes stop_codon:yes gene_type:complete
MSTRDKLVHLNDFLEKKKGSLISVAPDGADVDRIIRTAMFEASKNERLVSCTPASVYMALAKACELDLVAGGALHRASLVPMWNKSKKAYDAELWIEYTGLMELVLRSGDVSHFTAEVVYEKDEFECSFDLDGGKKLHHKQCFDGHPGELRLAYAVAHFKDGGHQVEVMRRDQINKIRKSSRNPDSGPWAQHTEEMWRKTVVRRICKYLPLSPKTKAVVEHDISSDFNEPTIIDAQFESDVVEVDNTTAAENVIEVEEAKPKRKRKTKVKDLVERAQANDLPEPEEDFTS